MLDIKKISSLDELNELKAYYFSQATAPLDGMWHFGFVPMSNHFGFYEENTLVGYCCLNAEGYLLQFCLLPTAKAKASDLFTLIVQNNSSVIGDVKGAFVSTAEPAFISLCMDNTDSFTMNALMYQQNEKIKLDCSERVEMTLANQEQLSKLVEFSSSAIGAPKEWLTSYYSGLIQRKELWAYWSNENIVATGECRRFDEYQKNYADLGMIVGKTERGKGLATRILNFLIQLANKEGLMAICSTEKTNIGAQKAIHRAGLLTNNRIVQFDFN